MEVKALQQMLSQFRQVQESLEKQMDGLLVEASAGGGMVTVKVSGDLQLKAVEIDPGAVDPEDVEILADMVLAAVNEALRMAQELAARKLSGAGGGLDLGGLGGLGLPGL